MDDLWAALDWVFQYVFPKYGFEPQWEALPHERLQRIPNIALCMGGEGRKWWPAIILMVLLQSHSTVSQLVNYY